MSNISTLISRGNSKKLKRYKNTEPPNCNCIKKENCPLQGRCQTECVVYKAEVTVTITIGMMKKVYVGSTQGLFKQKYYDHESSFTHEIYRHKTSLSKIK